MKLLPFLVLSAMLGIVLPLQAQPSPPGGGGGCTNCPPPPPNTNAPGRSIVELEIRYVGTLQVELFDRDKPASAKNFLRYVLDNNYTNSLIHRSITNSIFQGGSLRIIDFGGGNKAVVPVEEKPAVTNELMIGGFFSN